MKINSFKRIAYNKTSVPLVMLEISSIAND